VEDFAGGQEVYCQDCSFVRDRAGNMYWADRGAATIIRKRTPDGAITELCKSPDFRDVRWMTASAAGIVYLIDDDDLRRITPEGSVSTITRNLKERALSQAWMGGLWLLEYSTSNVARVRQIGRDGNEKIY
jgi:hypothetical protein